MPIIPEQVEGFPWPDPLYSSVQPFTYRDGTTYLQILRALDGYVKQLAQQLNGINSDASEALKAQIVALQSTVNDALDAQASAVNGSVNGMLDSMGELEGRVNDAVTEVVNSSITLQDPVVSALVRDTTSQLREALTDVYARKCTATITHVAPTETTVAYNVVTVTGGPGAVIKATPEANSSGVISSSNFVAPKVFAEEHGYSLVTTCDAGTGTGIIDGIDIVDGVVRRDWPDTVVGLQGAGLEALIINRDGSVTVARKSSGLTAQDYVNAGALFSAGYGPVLVEDGVDTMWYTNSDFSGFYSFVSARTIFGVTVTGDYKIIAVYGKSNADGIAGAEMSRIALAEGCHYAVNLDGGGSTQIAWGGEPVHASSDTAANGNRKLQSFLVSRAQLANEFYTGRYYLRTADKQGEVSAFQHGMLVGLEMSLKEDDPILKSWREVSTPLPSFMIPVNGDVCRGLVAGTPWAPVAASVGAPRTVSVRSLDDTAVMDVYGAIQWRARG